MNTEEKEQLRTHLLEERNSLVQKHARHEEDLRESRTSEDTAGPDFAADAEESEVEAVIVDSEVRLLEKIDHALQRIEEGSYGECESCGNAISYARLEAKPSVSLCIDCQEAKDAAE